MGHGGGLTSDSTPCYNCFIKRDVEVYRKNTQERVLNDEPVLQFRRSVLLK